jgi:hypothetical protein
MQSEIEAEKGETGSAISQLDIFVLIVTAKSFDWNKMELGLIIGASGIYIIRNYIA